MLHGQVVSPGHFKESLDESRIWVELNVGSEDEMRFGTQPPNVPGNIGWEEKLVFYCNNIIHFLVLVRVHVVAICFFLKQLFMKFKEKSMLQTKVEY